MQRLSVQDLSTFRDCFILYQSDSDINPPGTTIFGFLLYFGLIDLLLDAVSIFSPSSGFKYIPCPTHTPIFTFVVTHRSRCSTLHTSEVLEKGQKMTKACLKINYGTAAQFQGDPRLLLHSQPKYNLYRLVCGHFYRGGGEVPNINTVLRHEYKRS